MIKFIKKLLFQSKETQKRPVIKHDIATSFKLHGLVSSINNSPREEQIKALEVLRSDGHITETEYQKAIRDLEIE